MQINTDAYIPISTFFEFWQWKSALNFVTPIYKKGKRSVIADIYHLQNQSYYETLGNV